MKKRNILLWPAAALLGMASLSAQALPVNLFEYDVNVDGTPAYITWGDPVPSNVNVSAFNDVTGLGTITATFSGAGAHSFDAYFDHDLYKDNETGAVIGSASVGQSYEIDDPFGGDIFPNFDASALDNMNAALVQMDVAMAMGWDFTLAANEVADIVLQITDALPTTSNLILAQHNGPTQIDIYLTGSLNISTVPGNDTGKVPEPSMLFLMSAGLFGMVASRRRKNV